MMPTIYSTIDVARDHPSFAGHFPGRPILPGAVLLDMIYSTAARVAEWRILEFRMVKFLGAIPPGAILDVIFSSSGDGVGRVVCEYDGERVLEGAFSFDGSLARAQEGGSRAD